MKSTMILRASAKAAVLFLLFNLAYSFVQPVRNHLLPTLYNTLIPGRTRFSYESPLELDFLFNDHEIQRASADSYNIVVLGSSEIWGVYNDPDETISTFANRLNLTIADGRPVHFYDLSYPGPDLLKDFVILEKAQQRQYPIDLALIFINRVALNRNVEHQLLRTNTPFVDSVLDHYHLDPALFINPDNSLVSGPFWDDRHVLAYWLNEQVQAPEWAFARYDRTHPVLPEAMTEFRTSRPVADTTRDALFKALAEFRDEHDIPVLIATAPSPLINDHLPTWLAEKGKAAQIPVLSCSTVLDTPQNFLDSIHLVPDVHPIFAQILGRSLTEKSLVSLDSAFPLHAPNAISNSDTCLFMP